MLTCFYCKHKSYSIVVQIVFRCFIILFFDFILTFITYYIYVFIVTFFNLWNEFVFLHKLVQIKYSFIDFIYYLFYLFWKKILKFFIK